MPPSKRAVAAWEALNPRQRVYMAVFYAADQTAEQFWKSALLGYRLEVQLTTFGRAVCRAGGLDPDRPMAPRRGLLSQALWGMLAEVHEAGPEGLHRERADGAWTRLTQREPEPFVEQVPAHSSGSAFGYGGPWLLRLTDAGRAHYAAHWQEYARLYPGVDALAPDGGQVWPPEVDHELQRLREATWPPAALLKETRAELARLDDPPLSRTVEAVPGRGPLARIATGRNQAAAAYDAAVQRAAGRYRATLEEQAAELTGLRRQATARYAAAATAVVNAVVAGTSPADAVQQDPGEVEWPWAPAVPVTGLREVDEHLARQHPMATPAPPKKRSRAARAAQLTAGKTPRPQNDIGDRLFLYARELESLVAGGKLVRLLMRARLTSAET
jgi:hypothetical protein